MGHKTSISQFCDLFSLCKKGSQNIVFLFLCPFFCTIEERQRYLEHTILEFIGRNRELKKLKDQLSKRSARLIVIRGRRRIGKSRLITEFIQKSGLRALTFVGLKPVRKTTAESQRVAFSQQMNSQGIPGIATDDWSNLFWHLSEHTKSGPAILFFDEISWMGTKDFDFLGKLKNAWDQHFSNNPELILILCGSISSWIEEEILKSSAFLGRISLKIKLDELPLFQCNKFWAPHSDAISAYDKLKLLSVTGGIPRYLEEIDPSQPAEVNIRELCFEKEGLLFDEFDKIFADLFGRLSTTYEKLTRCLMANSQELTDLYKELEINKSSKLSSKLEELILAGFVAREHTWNIKTGEISNLSRYRLRDNYLRFYLKWIAPNRSRIEHDEFDDRPLHTLPGWDVMMGFQFENLVLNNRKAIQQILGLKPSEIVCNNPFFQRKTSQQQGCQIDYMIQTVHRFLYVCEIKFSRKPLTMKVVSEVQEKIRRLKTPKHCSSLPVLIHAGEVDEEVVHSNYFVKIIDFGDLLTTELPI